MITAVSEATVPKVSVIVRKAYGAGLYAMAGPAFGPDATHRAAHGQDRGDGPRGGGQRGVRQQDRRDRRRRRARGVRRRAAAPSTRTTSTCSAWPRSSSSTPWSSPPSSGASSCCGSRSPRARTATSATAATGSPRYDRERLGERRRGARRGAARSAGPRTGRTPGDTAAAVACPSPRGARGRPHARPQSDLHRSRRAAPRDGATQSTLTRCPALRRRGRHQSITACCRCGPG